ncbi:unnamed protein product [Vitrella brassicaformis CCMP3155]|uniref:Uncharacterized protein n=1 Tax=Vitrella brassicaformis (strain CCMP3155) TaxID=1169540 RepID=A0A0G4EKN2_VITBC|nr:unnamed protein product [Vitrella brassicaformis CCMP3155]|eukprot:CEL98005.1 unnamed protein product [Vitrella brassicaformis CCMP3155]
MDDSFRSHPQAGGTADTTLVVEHHQHDTQTQVSTERAPEVTIGERIRLVKDFDARKGSVEDQHGKVRKGEGRQDDDVVTVDDCVEGDVVVAPDDLEVLAVL